MIMHLCDGSNTPLIDQLHHAMQSWKEEKRGDLVKYLRENDLLDHVPYWKLAQALFEVLPRDEEDWKLIFNLLGLLKMHNFEVKIIIDNQITSLVPSTTIGDLHHAIFKTLV